MNPDEPPAMSHSTARHLARLGGAAVLLGLFGAAMWFAWLGWDTEYYQVDGVAQGPYRSWQVVGCGLSVAVAAVLALLWVRGTWAIFVLATAAVVGFVVPWTAHAAATDPTGLYGVGVVMILVGGGLALVVLLALTSAIASAVAPRRLPSEPVVPGPI